MAKIDLENIQSGYQSTIQVNNNSLKIEDELNNKVLYRDNPEGEPNQMLNNLDMNSNDILNAGIVRADQFIGTIDGRSSEEWARISRDWAIKTDGLVESEDFSSKHYAGESETSATGAKASEEAAAQSEELAEIAALISVSAARRATDAIDGIEDAIDLVDGAIEKSRFQPNADFNDVGGVTPQDWGVLRDPSIIFENEDFADPRYDLSLTDGSYDWDILV